MLVDTDLVFKFMENGLCSCGCFAPLQGTVLMLMVDLWPHWFPCTPLTQEPPLGQPSPACSPSKYSHLGRCFPEFWVYFKLRNLFLANVLMDSLSLLQNHTMKTNCGRIRGVSLEPPQLVVTLCGFCPYPGWPHPSQGQSQRAYRSGWESTDSCNPVFLPGLLLLAVCVYLFKFTNSKINFLGYHPLKVLDTMIRVLALSQSILFLQT